jgi:hypothetical protein
MATAKATRGARLVASVRAEMAELGCSPTSTEEELLRVASTLADRLDELEKMIKKDGLMVTTSRGDLRTHPAAAEHRAVATNLARVLGGVYVGDSVTRPSKDARKQRAARRRWDRADGTA